MPFFFLESYHFISVLVSVFNMYRNGLQVLSWNKLWSQVPAQGHSVQAEAPWLTWQQALGEKLRRSFSLFPQCFTWVYTKEWPLKPVDMCPPGVISMFLPQRMQEVHISLCRVSSKMASLARKSHGRASTDTHRTGARLPSPHMGMTKAHPTSQHGCGICILLTPPSPFPTSYTCSCTATQNLPSPWSPGACSSACSILASSFH